jgi:hypothetical protein
MGNFGYATTALRASIADLKDFFPNSTQSFLFLKDSDTDSLINILARKLSKECIHYIAILKTVVLQKKFFNRRKIQYLQYFMFKCSVILNIPLIFLENNFWIRIRIQGSNKNFLIRIHTFKMMRNL